MKKNTTKHYPIKVLFSWGLAIGGDKKIRDWLLKSQYKELGVFVYALNLKDDARAWLLKNHPELMALINAVEENKHALLWLKNHGYEAMYYLALASLEKPEGIQWLNKHEMKELLFVAQQIDVIKHNIEVNNSDPFKISKE